MTRTATKARKGATGTHHEAIPAHGAVIEVALGKLKKSPRNARRTPHSAAHLEALAASIGAKGMLQKPVVEPEYDAEGAFTGCWLVTIGEGRRLAQMLRVGRKEIGRGTKVSCVVDLANDPEEISLDENVTREDLHPADQFEAFLDQSQRLGRSAEEIAARFGVTPLVVRRRLRLARVSPKLLAAYREGQLDLDQLMAFAVSEDRARQEWVFDGLPPYKVDPSYIRRQMTDAKVTAADRRAVFVGVDAYEAAGGTVLPDLFTEDRGGWLEDVALLDRLALEKLAAEAGRIRETEGWKWAEAFLDYPYDRALQRAYPVQVQRTEPELARIAALSDEYDALITQWDHLDEAPPEVEARLRDIDAELQAFGDGYAYRSEDMARAGVQVILGHDAEVRIERGFLRAEDIAPEPDAQPGAGREGGDEGEEGRGERREGGDPGRETEDEADDASAPLSAALVAELTAYRTAGLRDALADDPDAASQVMVHALALQAFYNAPHLTCADLRLGSTGLTRDAPKVADCPAMVAIEARHQAWVANLPRNPHDLWAYVVALDHDSRMALLAHCVGLSLNGVHGWERRLGAWTHADALATRVGLDMTRTWTATAESYFGRVTKARIAEAVRTAVSDEAAERIGGLKKPEMAAAAERLVEGVGWLPPLLRTPDPASEDAAPVAEPEGEPQDRTAQPAAEAIAAE